jgi:hypothetical protein
MKIETGRYQGTLLQDRKCEHCSAGELEDEYHFLFHCNKLENEKRESYSNILIVTVEVPFQLRTPRDNAQCTVI